MCFYLVSLEPLSGSRIQFLVENVLRLVRQVGPEGLSQSFAARRSVGHESGGYVQGGDAIVRQVLGQIRCEGCREIIVSVRYFVYKLLQN